MGKPVARNGAASLPEYMGIIEGIPGELLALKLPGGRESKRDSLSSGRAKREQPNRKACLSGL